MLCRRFAELPGRPATRATIGPRKGHAGPQEPPGIHNKTATARRGDRMASCAERRTSRTGLYPGVRLQCRPLSQKSVVPGGEGVYIQCRYLPNPASRRGLSFCRGAGCSVAGCRSGWVVCAGKGLRHVFVLRPDNRWKRYISHHYPCRWVVVQGDGSPDVSHFE